MPSWSPSPVPSHPSTRRSCVDHTRRRCRSTRRRARCARGGGQGRRRPGRHRVRPRDRAARRRPRPARGRAGRGQDPARQGAGRRPRPRLHPGAVHPRPDAVGRDRPADLHERRRHRERPGTSASGRARSSPTCSSPTRSTARRPRPRPRCSRRWRSGRSPSRDRPARCPTRSSSSPPRTRSSTRAPTRCPRRSWTGSCSSCTWATRRPSRSRRCCVATTAGLDPHDVASVVRPVATAADLAAARLLVDDVRRGAPVLAYLVSLARATRESPSLSLGVSPRGTAMLLHAAKAWAWLAGRDVRHARRGEGHGQARPPPPDPAASRGGAGGRHRRWRCSTASWPRCPVPR